MQLRQPACQTECHFDGGVSQTGLTDALKLLGNAANGSGCRCCAPARLPPSSQNPASLTLNVRFAPHIRSLITATWTPQLRERRGKNSRKGHKRQFIYSTYCWGPGTLRERTHSESQRRQHNDGFGFLGREVWGTR